jgi:anti-sigma regulatory factor (Ser/Thr protein kinase)
MRAASQPPDLTWRPAAPCQRPASWPVTLPAVPRAAMAAREFAITTLASWDVPELAADDVAMVVSELVANASRASSAAGKPVVAVWLTRTDAGVRVAAGDSSPSPVPSPPAPEASAERGRGLVIVVALCARHGWYRSGPWKIVWGEVDAAIPVADAEPEHEGVRARSAAALASGARSTPSGRAA